MVNPPLLDAAGALSPKERCYHEFLGRTYPTRTWPLGSAAAKASDRDRLGYTASPGPVKWEFAIAALALASSIGTVHQVGHHWRWSRRLGSVATDTCRGRVVCRTRVWCGCHLDRASIRSRNHPSRNTPLAGPTPGPNALGRSPRLTWSSQASSAAAARCRTGWRNLPGNRGSLDSPFGNEVTLAAR